MSIGITGLDHVNLVARNIKLLRAFYSEIIGLEVDSEFRISEPELSRGLGIPAAGLEVIFWRFPGSSTLLEMVEYFESADDTVQSSFANAPGFGHLAMRVSNIEETFAVLSSRGAPFESPPVTVGQGVRFCFLRDPEGNILEIIQPS